jgi:hypothetical protein
LNIKYKKGITNHITYYLNRPPVVALPIVLNLCGQETSGWLQSHNNDSKFVATYQTLNARKKIRYFHLPYGLLYHIRHMCVASSECLKLILESHYSRAIGHFGMQKKMVVLQNHLYWSNLRQDINKYIKTYTPFFISKPANKKQGLYIPLPTSDRPWESISMDYMSDITSTKHGNDCVFVVVDRFSQMEVLKPSKKIITTQACIGMFVMCTYLLDLSNMISSAPNGYHMQK